MPNEDELEFQIAELKMMVEGKADAKARIEEWTAEAIDPSDPERQRLALLRLPIAFEMIKVFERGQEYAWRNIENEINRRVAG